MKRELSPHLAPWQGEQQRRGLEVRDDDICYKRLKVAKVNGFIVYSRVKKSKSSEENKIIKKSLKEVLPTDSENSITVIESESFETVKMESRGLENVILGQVNGSVKCKDEPVSEAELKKLARLTSLNNNNNNNNKVEEVEVAVSGLERIDGDVISRVDVEMIDEGSALTPPKKNLELKMSKKISLHSVPMTVKELFDTGLLDGVPVVYMGGKKFQAFDLRGTIKDGGILCSCDYCKGCRVIPPSQFEIHAIKQYRRAGQYICFENGKSLLDVLNACRTSRLDSLEATIQNAISGLPVVKTFTCKRCKGTFPSMSVGKIGPLCSSCAGPKESHGSTTCEIKARSSKPRLKIKPLPSSPVRISARKKSERNITPTSLEPDFVTKPSKSVSAASEKKKQGKITPRKSKSISLSKSFKSVSADVSPQTKHQWKMTRKDQRLHKLVFEEGGLPDGTEVAYYARGQKLLVGYKRGFGIICCCCNCEVSPSTFEAHAGWATRKKPYAYIYTSNGVSLHELAISLSKGRKYSAKDNDDLCIVCADGGNLVLCDGCPRAFHKECASLSSVPRGDWYCQFCQNLFEREKFVEHNANAIAAGRVSGVDSIEQITKRCIRIVKDIEAELSGCALCRCYDFSRSGFGPRTIILCDQCEKEFHVGCLRSHKMANLKELPKGKWFCCMDCSRIHSALQKLLVCEAEKLPDTLLDVLKKKYKEKDVETISDIDVRWRLISGRFASPETKLLLSQALSIFQECFDPIVDSTGRDLIPLMLYGKNSKGQDYGGMYCAVLLVNSFVVSAGIFRVFGQEVAEIPLVATSNGNHGKGYFQLLFSCIEKLLGFLNVQSLVLPAAEEAESIWTDKFGFQKIKPDQLSKYRKSCCQMVCFEGTSMLQKEVPACRVVNQSPESVL